MANALYGKGKEAMLKGLVDLSGGVVKVVLVDTGSYTVNLNTHEFLSDIPLGARTSITAALTGKTYTLGVFDAADPALPDTGGATSEALVVFIDTGVAGTSRLICYLDTGTGLPIVEDSTADVITWPGAGIFAL